MAAPSDRRYSDTHEWHKPEGQVVTLGITRFAIDELTDITFVQLPKPGTQVRAGSPIGEIESVKATAELYSGVSGVVSQVNEAVVKDPSIINQDPYEKGWLVKIEATNPSELVHLHDSAAYEAKFPSH